MDTGVYRPPPCPDCCGVATMPARMGMSANNCKCNVCGKVFGFVALGLVDVGQFDLTALRAINARRSAIQHG